MGQLEEALAAYNRTIELEPAFEIAWDNKGVTLARLGRFEEALEAYEKVLVRSPKYTEAGQEKARFFLLLARKKKSLKLIVWPLKSGLIISKL